MLKMECTSLTCGWAGETNKHGCPECGQTLVQVSYPDMPEVVYQLDGSGDYLVSFRITAQQLEEIRHVARKVADFSPSATAMFTLHKSRLHVIDRVTRERVQLLNCYIEAGPDVFWVRVQNAYTPAMYTELIAYDHIVSKLQSRPVQVDIDGRPVRRTI